MSDKIILRELWFCTLISGKDASSMHQYKGNEDLSRDLSRCKIQLATGCRRQWQPTPVLLPGRSHGWRSLVGCSPRDCQEQDTTERLHFHFSLFTFMLWRRKWQPTPVFLPGESQGRENRVGCCLWGHTESDMTEATQQQDILLFIGK